MNWVGRKCKMNDWFFRKRSWKIKSASSANTRGLTQRIKNPWVYAGYREGEGGWKL
jgi:hypothetical protein